MWFLPFTVADFILRTQTRQSVRLFLSFSWTQCGCWSQSTPRLGARRPKHQRRETDAAGLVQSQDRTIRGECGGSWLLHHPLSLSKYISTTCQISALFCFFFLFSDMFTIKLSSTRTLSQHGFKYRYTKLDATLANFKMLISFLMNVRSLTSLCLCVRVWTYITSRRVGPTVLRSALWCTDFSLKGSNTALWTHTIAKPTLRKPSEPQSEKKMFGWETQIIAAQWWSYSM